MHLYFAQPAERVIAAVLRGNELHVLNEERNDGHLRGLRDVVQTRLAGADMDTVATCAFGKYDERALAARATKGLEFSDAVRVQLPAFEQEPDRGAQHLLEPGCVPHLAIAEHENRVTTRAPADRTEQDGVNEADVIADNQPAATRL